MDKAQVLEQFALLAGLDTGEALRYSALADGVMARVRGMLRNTVRPEEHSARLEALCGALCYYQYALRLEGVTEESVRALNVSVTRKHSSRLAGAEAIRNDAVLAARNLLRDDEFYCG